MTTARRLDGYTLDDWASLDPQEGRRIELVDGRFVVTPASPIGVPGTESYAAIRWDLAR